MRILKLSDLLLQEAFVPDKSEFEKALAADENGIISLYMDDKGYVHIDYPPFGGKGMKASAKLYYAKKRIILPKRYLHGNKITHGAAQLLKGLYKNDIVDAGWKVSFSDSEGYYMGGQFKYRKGEYEDLPINFWKNNSPMGVGENLVMYHGTSDLQLPKIEKYGLRPLGFKGTFAGHETRLKTDWNKNTLYLAGTFDDAFRYAKLRALSDMRDTDPKNFEFLQHYEWERWTVKPVVILATIPDFTKLRSDDDRIISIIKEKGTELWKSMDDATRKAEQEKAVQWFKERGVNYTPDRIEDYLWSMTDSGLAQILSQIHPDEWKKWEESLSSHNQVGYEGTIPPKFLKVLDLKQVTDKYL